MTDRRLFYVTGMHRSGTSALTRVINLLGASVGPPEDLMPAQADNPTGFWEIRAVARLNNEILASHGGSWQSRPAGSIARSGTGSASWTDKIAVILDQLRESGPGPYVLKDPRFAWTMSVWESVAPPDVVVVAVRAPEEVCGSLNRRNAIGQEDAAALWVEYVQAAMSTGHPCMVVDYAHLIGTPEDTTRGIATALCLPDPSPTTLHGVREFLDPDLCHANTSTQEPPSTNLDEARRLYESLAKETKLVRRLGTGNARPQYTGAASIRAQTPPKAPNTRQKNGMTMTASTPPATQPPSSPLAHSMQSVYDYLSGPFAHVDGWCIPQLWQSIQPISEVQDKNGINGPIAEIGVYHGKFFIGLMKTKGQEDNYALDVFSMQQFNLDGAGAGNLAKFQANIVAAGGSLDHVHSMEVDSMAVTRADLAAINAATGGFSMFSVDGCHTVEHTINDTRIAMELTRPGGVIFVDDYYNANWPGVQEGIAKLYHTDSPRFVPLVATCNKLILCHISHHAEHLAYVEQFVRGNFPTTRVKKVRRFGYDGLTVAPNYQNGPYLANQM